ncbi:uncharacterized protein LOC133392661 [Anopheles gambiae]|uniref:uncharacterized protein LOC133392661 n=1 Tax=Anopheles gambiae TaxID=7165 RepID=UPI002AC97CA9|nr:uncharacterized protein LOC133392661 [Anopheles gambiae]
MSKQDKLRYKELKRHQYMDSINRVKEFCEQYFKQTTNRDHTGRYVVRMPKHHDYAQMLGDSKAAAQKRFRLLEQRLAKDKHLKQQYDDFMREYVTLGHMFPVPVEEDSMAAVHYLPHHPVVKESSTTTKVRVVFDGSAKTTTGHSLNDVLHVGPVVQDELLSLVVRFRKYKVAVIADIEKMYRQETEVVQTFELATVTYGLAPSSFLATRTLLQLAEDEGAPYPLATEAVKKTLYVDDLISGAESIEQAIQLRDELTSLMNWNYAQPC